MAADADSAKWLRFDLTNGAEKDVSISEVRDACADVGMSYENAFIAGQVRVGPFSYELDENDDEPDWFGGEK